MRRYIPLLLAALCAATGLAATLETPAEVVRKLYGAFPASGPFGIQTQTAQVLSRYFDPEMVRLIRRDADCTERTKDPCNLDTDPLWAANFPGQAGASIVAAGAGKVRVVLRYPDGRAP